MRALILCAGLGERLRPLTLRQAKPAIEFLNVPMLAYPYHWLNTLDLSDVVFNTHFLPDSVRHAAMHVVAPGTQLHFTFEDTILGSGGGIWNARFHLQWDDTFAVANGDGVVTFAETDALEQMLRFHRQKKALATLLTCPLEGVGTKIPGVWVDHYGEVGGFGKTSPQSHMHCLHYASYMLLDKRVWERLPEGSSNILYDVLEPAIAEGEKVYSFSPDNMRWFETGNIADYLSASKQCLEILRDKSPLARGLEQMLEQFAAPFSARSDWRQLRLLADSATVADLNSLSGFCVVGEDARIAASASLQDCVVLPGAHVGAPHRNMVVT